MVHSFLKPALAVLFLIFAVSLYGETLYFGKGEYEHRPDGWWLCDPADDYRVNPRLISVVFKPGVTVARIDSLNGTIGTTVMRRTSRGIYDLSLYGRDPMAIAHRYQGSGLAEIVDIQTIGRVFARPNDEYFPMQWHLAQLSGDDIRVIDGWDIETGKGIVLAFIDTGIDIHHPDLRRNLWVNPGEIPGNGFDDDRNGYVDDIHGYHLVYDSPDLTRGINVELVYNNGVWRYALGYHGTKTSGIAAAETNNMFGVAGVAGGWNGGGGSRIMMLGGADSAGCTFTEKIRDAIYYAVDNGAKVINMSLGCGESEGIKAAIDTAASHGIVMVASSGYTNSADIAYPARDPDVISVGAVGSNRLKIPHSSHGRKIDPLDVVAPSGETLQDTPVYTTFPTGYRGSNGYAWSSQTSSAAPQAAGLACLLLSLDPLLTPERIREIICKTADKVGPSTYTDWPDAPYGGWDDSLGYGRINVFKALFSIRGQGRITTNTTWYTNMELNGDVIVEAERTLRIGKNVRVSFAAGKKLIVYGKLIADSGAVFTKTAGGDFWSGIDIRGEGVMETTGNTMIESADTGLEIGDSGNLLNDGNRIIIRRCGRAGIWINGCSPTIRNVLLDRVSLSYGQNAGIVVSGNGASPEIQGVAIRNSRIGMLFASPGGVPKVDSCTIDNSNAEHSVVIFPGCGADLNGGNTFIPRAGKKAISSYQNSLYPVHAENNWWGRSSPDWKALFTWPDSILVDNARSAPLSSAKIDPEGQSDGSGEEFVRVMPNPANPSTTITFSLSHPSKVRLTVYSITGQKVAVLVDGFRSAGVHAVRFDGAKLASGVYLWSFESPEFRRTGKMVILR